VRAGRAYVGTSGFGYTSWIPRFYPEGTKAKALLRAYAARLSSVESNYTFNALPSEEALANWVDATPASFRFALKASRRITHDAQLRDIEDSLPRFLDRVRRLGDRLGCILYQTPPWFKRDDDRLHAFLAALPADLRAAFEFRDSSWYQADVYALLRSRNAALVTAEGERAPAPFTLTADFTYVRLRQKERAYTDEALLSWLHRLADCLRSGQDAYVYLYHDEAGENALRAMRLAQALAAV
jgi:uncharacterized protein YecE (DUF72 family)